MRQHSPRTDVGGAVPATLCLPASAPMQSPHVQLIHRAHNRFTPSAIVRQHLVPVQFVGLRKRLVSSAIEVGSRPPEQYGLSSDDPAAVGPIEPRVVGVTEAATGTPEWTIRRMTTVKGRWQSSKVEAAVITNNHKRFMFPKASLNERQKILVATKAAYDAEEDYEGVIVKPVASLQSSKDKDVPWRCKDTEQRLSGRDKLAVEIDRFYEYAKPDRYEHFARKYVTEQVRDHVRQTLPDHVLVVFGSEKTGLAFATSDIDFRLIQTSTLADPEVSRLPPTRAERMKAKGDLNDLYWKNLRKNKAYRLPALLHARYPLISMQDRQSQLDVQIVLSNNTTVSRKIMQNYLEQYPYLRNLYFVVKTMFDIRGLSDVFHGGFGSYSIFMMIVASIRHKPHSRNDAVGGLINFLQFWSDFDTRKQVVSLEPPELLDKNSVQVTTQETKVKFQGGKVKPLPPYMLSLRDPADEANDLGHKGIAIKHVQATLRSLLQQLRWDLKANTRPSMLGPLVGPWYTLNYARRQRLREYGKSLTVSMCKV